MEIGFLCPGQSKAGVRASRHVQPEVVADALRDIRNAALTSPAHVWKDKGPARVATEAILAPLGVSGPSGSKTRRAVVSYDDDCPGPATLRRIMGPAPVQANDRPL